MNPEEKSLIPVGWQEGDQEDDWPGSAYTGRRAQMVRGDERERASDLAGTCKRTGADPIPRRLRCDVRPALRPDLLL